MKNINVAIYLRYKFLASNLMYSHAETSCTGTLYIWAIVNGQMLTQFKQMVNRQMLTLFRQTVNGQLFRHTAMVLKSLGEF